MLSFKWRHFEKEIILLNVKWYLAYPLGSVAKKQITLLPTIIRLNFSQRRFACSTKGVYIFQAVAFLNAT